MSFSGNKKTLAKLKESGWSQKKLNSTKDGQQIPKKYKLKLKGLTNYQNTNWRKSGWSKKSRCGRWLTGNQVKRGAHTVEGPSGNECGKSLGISSRELMRLIYCRCAEKPMSHHHTYGEKTCTPASSRDTGFMIISVVSTTLLVAKCCNAVTPIVSAEIWKWQIIPPVFSVTLHFLTQYNTMCAEKLLQIIKSYTAVFHC